MYELSAEFRTRRELMGITTQQVAAALGIEDVRTVERWEGGRRISPPPAVAVEWLGRWWEYFQQTIGAAEDDLADETVIMSMFDDHCIVASWPDPGLESPVVLRRWWTDQQVAESGFYPRGMTAAMANALTSILVFNLEMLDYEVLITYPEEENNDHATS